MQDVTTYVRLSIIRRKSRSSLNIPSLQVQHKRCWHNPHDQRLPPAAQSRRAQESRRAHVCPRRSRLHAAGGIPAVRAVLDLQGRAEHGCRQVRDEVQSGRARISVDLPGHGEHQGPAA